MQEFTITMTSKGQFTMPVALRKAFDLNVAGDKLKIKFNATTKQAKIEKPVTFDEIQALSRKYLKPGIQPLLDPRAFYNTRPPRI